MSFSFYMQQRIVFESRGPCFQGYFLKLVLGEKMGNNTCIENTFYWKIKLFYTMQYFKYCIIGYVFVYVLMTV